MREPDAKNLKGNFNVILLAVPCFCLGFFTHEQKL